jgi:hypothetical protein
MDNSTLISEKVAANILDNSMFNISKINTDEGISKKMWDNSISRNEDIDVGVCGIILFLIELNKINPEPRIQKAILDASEAMINHCKLINRFHYGFYKGRGGVCYTLMQIFRNTGNETCLSYALDFIKSESDDFIGSEFTNNRLFDGRSGLLLVLLNLYDLRAEQWIYDKLIHCLNKIVEEFVFTKEGIFWNKGESNINSLNSFLYGSSGVAFALSQVGDYFNCMELTSMAKSIFMFEDMHWDKKLSNWPDFRNEILTGEDYDIHKYEYKNRNFSFFTIPSESYSLAFGTAGICLSRLPFLTMGNDRNMKCKLTKGIKKLLDFRTDNLSLANGIIGVGSLLIEASNYFNDPSYFKNALDIGNEINKNKISFQDMSLFNGLTGVGYFYLQLQEPASFQSVLLPVQKKSNAEKEVFIDGSVFVVKSVKLNFPYTFVTLQNLIPDMYLSLIRYLDFENNNNLISNAEKLITSFSNLLSPKQNQMIHDVLAMETAKLRMFYETKSYSMNHIADTGKYEEKISLMNMDKEELLKQVLVFEKDVRIIALNWNWSRLNQPEEKIPGIISEFLNTRAKKVKIMLYKNKGNSIDEEKLDTFGQLTQRIFRTELTVSNAIDEYIKAFDIDNDSEKEQIIINATKYINHYIKKSLLHRRY